MSKHQDSQQIPLFPELQPEAPGASLAKWGRGQAEASPLRLVSSGPGESVKPLKRRRATAGSRSIC